MNDDYLTRGMARDLDRLRDWRRRHGQDPTPREWARVFGMCPASADAALGRLAAAGFTGPRRPHRLDARGGGPSPAELEVARVRELLVEADRILSTIQVNDRAARDEWRKRAAGHLDRPEAA